MKKEYAIDDEAYKMSVQRGIDDPTLFLFTLEEYMGFPHGDCDMYCIKELDMPLENFSEHPLIKKRAGMLSIRFTLGD